MRSSRRCVRTLSRIVAAALAFLCLSYLIKRNSPTENVFEKKNEKVRFGHDLKQRTHARAHTHESTHTHAHTYSHTYIHRLKYNMHYLPSYPALHGRKGIKSLIMTPCNSQSRLCRAMPLMDTTSYLQHYYQCWYHEVFLPCT